MSIAPCLKNYLDQHHVSYELIPHRHTNTSFTSAQAAHVPEECMVKGVLLHDEYGYLLVAVPSTREINIGRINRQTGRQLALAEEGVLPCVFNDCEMGAVPALGEAYGIPMVWDQSLVFQPNFYIEAGDHRALVRLQYQDYMALLQRRSASELMH